MIEFYSQIKWIHVCTVLISGSIFLLRGTASLAGARWVMAAPLRFLTYTIDTVLLTSAVMLAMMLHQIPLVHAWITLKILLLLVYIVLGVIALRPQRPKRVRIISFLAALLTYVYIIGIARAHHPLSWFRFWFD